MNNERAANSKINIYILIKTKVKVLKLKLIKIKESHSEFILNSLFLKKVLIKISEIVGTTFEI
jgi:hypothetical protein